MEKPLKILLIEDNPGDIRLIREFLNMGGNSAFLIENCNRLNLGLERLRNNDIDIVLLDLTLPDSDGLNTFHAIESINYYVPVIILSGLDDESMAIKAVREGAQDYLVKGKVDRDLLIRSIHYAIERKRTDEALTEEHHLLRMLVDNLPDFVFIKDAESRFILMNPKLAEIMNTTTEAAIGKTDFDFFPQGFSSKSYEDEQKIIRTGQPLINYEESVPDHATGGMRWSLVTKIPLRDSHGHLTGILGISRDITARKHEEEEIRLNMEKVRKAMEGTIQALSMIVESRDPYTAGHQQKVTTLACAIADELRLPADTVDGIKFAAMVHDLGKIHIPPEILSKPGKISEIEYAIVKSHPEIGYQILKSIEFPWPIAEIVLWHHKRLNGSGYPEDLPVNDIMMETKILGVADVVAAMTSHRPYREAIDIDTALKELQQNSGILYDPHVVRTCIELFREKNFLFGQ
ncbi:MAG: HD domain-containing phosphohydrolase [Bacillota bacterium]